MSFIGILSIAYPLLMLIVVVDAIVHHHKTGRWN